MSDLIKTEQVGAVALIGLNRPEKRNAFNLELFGAFARAYTAAEQDEATRAILLWAEGSDFTTGLDLANVAPAFLEGRVPFEEGQVEPWGVFGPPRKKPLIVAAQGRCFTLGLELGLAADAFVVERGCTFNLREVQVGIIPAGGGIYRFIQAAGYNRAMRYILTGDNFDASEAERLGLVSEVVDEGSAKSRALQLAQRIASAAPLAVAAALQNAFLGLDKGEVASRAVLTDTQASLIRTEDAMEGAMAAMQRREPQFKGR